MTTGGMNRFARRLYQVALRIYPRWFRARYGADALESFERGYRTLRRRNGRLAAARFAAAAIVDAVRTGICAHRGAATLQDSRKARSIPLFADLRHALGTFRRQLRLSVAAALCAAIGIAATGAIVTLIDLTVFEPLPFPDSDRLVRIWNEDTSTRAREQLSWPGYLDLADELDHLSQLEATARARLMFIRPDGSRRVEGEAVTPGYFDMLGVEPLVGRLFTRREYDRESERVMVLSYRAWGALFDHDPDVIGTTIRTNNQYSTNPAVFTVVGVMKPSFIGTIEDDLPDIEFWVPVADYLYDSLREARNARFVLTLGRLAPGATMAQARQELAALSMTLGGIYPDARENLGHRIESFGSDWRERFQRGNAMLLVAAALLLAVAAANVAGLLLARATERHRELGIRAALGATRGQIARQLLLETMVVVICGGASGLVLAPYLLTRFVALSAVEVPAYIEIAPDAGALLISGAVLLLTGLCAGLLPAFVAARAGIAPTIGAGATRVAGGRRSSRVATLLVLGEVSFTFVLVVCSGLLLRSYDALQATDLGFRTDGLLRMALFVDDADVPEDQGLPAFYQRVRDAVGPIPEVQNVALVSPTLPIVEPPRERLRFAGMPEVERDNGLEVAPYFVGPAFFDTLEIPLLAGRGITAGDTFDAPPALVVGRLLAERMGGVERAVGQRVEMSGSEFLVVGVTEDTSFAGPNDDRPHDLEVYGSLEQSPARIVSLQVVSRGDPLAVAPDIRRRIAEIAPRSAFDWTDDVQTFVAGTYRDTRFFTLLIGAFTVSSLTLAAIGLYAMLANLVAHSTMEIGVRKSFGATAGDVLVATLRRGLTLVGIALVAGLALTVAVVRALEGLLYGVQAFDPLAFGAAAGLVLIIAVAASLIPARRAAAVDPMEAMRP